MIHDTLFKIVTEEIYQWWKWKNLYLNCSVLKILLISYFLKTITVYIEGIIEKKDEICSFAKTGFSTSDIDVSKKNTQTEKQIRREKTHGN